MSLKDKVVLLTGATRGIGKATALRHGAPAVASRAFDLADGAAIAACFREARSRLGPIDVLINRASRVSPACCSSRRGRTGSRSLPSIPAAIHAVLTFPEELVVHGLKFRPLVETSS